MFRGLPILYNLGRLISFGLRQWEYTTTEAVAKEMSMLRLTAYCIPIACTAIHLILKKMNYNDKNYIPSRTSPKGDRRGCLCWETSTYSLKCCDGSVRAQGVGSVYFTDED